MKEAIQTRLYSNLSHPMSKYKEQIRTINIDGIRYRWRNTHRHEFITTRGKWGCVDHFVAFREGTSGVAFRIRFTCGYASCPPGHIGLIIVPPRLWINLHLPRCAAALIRRALELGWSSDAPMTVQDGDTFIANLPKSVLMHLAETPVQQ